MKDQTNIVYLFHIYQPPWQTKEVLEENYNKFYLPLLEVLESRPNYKVTLNISASLTEQLAREGKQEFFDRVRVLVKKGQIELTGSAAYHPILPLIPEKEAIRQINLNDEINSKYFKEEWTLAKTRGFFLPELAYSTKVSKIIKGLGFDWLSVDQTTVAEQVNWSKQYSDKSSGIKLLINNRVFYTPDVKKFSQNKYNVIISDGENQINKDKQDIDWSLYLSQSDPGLESRYLTVSEYLKEVENEQDIIPTENSNWQIKEEEKKVGSYYHLWKNDNEPIHKLLWEFLFDVMKVVEQNNSDDNFNFARTELDKGLASCTWWWVDGRIYGYNPTAVVKGLDIIVNAMRTLKDINLETRIRIERSYSEIVFEVWKRHWTNFNKN
ncbi:MAG: hypothetical protein ABI721_00575 [Candidatus Dojkabacteria bacterium]